MSSREQKIAQRTQSSITRVTKTIFPSMTNHHNTLFGGQALAWMDDVAFVAATRFCRKPLVTVSSEKIDFKEPIPEGTFAELVAQVVYVGNTSLKVQVDIFLENMYEDNQHKAISGIFSFVALDENKRPTAVLTNE